MMEVGRESLSPGMTSMFMQTVVLSRYHWNTTGHLLNGACTYENDSRCGVFSGILGPDDYPYETLGGYHGSLA